MRQSEGHQFAIGIVKWKTRIDSPEGFKVTMIKSKFVIQRIRQQLFSMYLGWVRRKTYIDLFQSEITHLVAEKINS